MAVVADERWSGAFPRRDDEARARLAEVAGHARPAVGAADRLIAVPGPLGEVLPGGGMRRGGVYTVGGTRGAGSTSVVLALAAAVTNAGEWAALVDPHGTVGGRAAAEAGVVLERLAVVRHAPAPRWSTIVAALLDGFAFVAADVPRHCRLGDARRLAAKARERSAVLVACGPWPAEASARVHASGSQWSGLGAGEGLLAAREVRVEVEGRGAPARARLAS